MNQTGHQPYSDTSPYGECPLAGAREAWMTNIEMLTQAIDHFCKSDNYEWWGCRGFESQHRRLDGYFLHCPFIYVVKLQHCCLKRLKTNNKMPGIAHLLNKQWHWTDRIKKIYASLVLSVLIGCSRLFNQSECLKTSVA